MPLVRQGRWRVVATKPGYAPGEALIVAGGGGTEIEIQMTRTEGVSFEVALQSGAATPATLEERIP